MRACRIAGRSAGRPVCGKYRITASCFFEGGSLPSKKETDSKAIIALHPSEFPIFHRSSPLWVLYLCDLEICKFFRINTLEE